MKKPCCSRRREGAGRKGATQAKLGQCRPTLGHLHCTLGHLRCPLESDTARDTRIICIRHVLDMYRTTRR